MPPIAPGADLSKFPNMPPNMGVSGLFEETTSDGSAGLAFYIKNWRAVGDQNAAGEMLVGRSSRIEAIARGVSHGFIVQGVVASRDPTGLNNSLDTLVGDVTFNAGGDESLTFRCIADQINVSVEKRKSDWPITARVQPVAQKFGSTDVADKNVVVEVLRGASFRDENESRNDTGRRRFWIFNLSDADYTIDSATMCPEVATAIRSSYGSFGGQSLRHVSTNPLRHNAVEAVAYYGPSSFFEFASDSPDIEVSLGTTTITAWKDLEEEPDWLLTDANDFPSPVLKRYTTWDVYYTVETTTNPITGYGAYKDTVNDGTFLGAAAGTLKFIGMRARAIGAGEWLAEFSFIYLSVGWYEDQVARNKFRDWDPDSFQRVTPDQADFSVFPTP